MVLDPVLHEQRHRIAVRHDLLGLARHQHAHEVAGFLVARLALDPDLVDVLVVEVPDGALHQILFLIDEGGRDGVQSGLADVLPKPQQVVVVALDLGLGALGAGGAHDQAHALRHVQAGDHALQALAVGGGVDLARNAAAPGGVGHQHAIAAGQGQVGGERRALVAALFLDDLDQHDLPAADHFLDLVAAHQPALAARQLLFHHVVIVVGDRVGFVVVVLVGGFDLAPVSIGGAAAAATAAGRALVLVVLLGLLAQQGFAVGDRDLVVVRVDFVEGQKAVAVAAVLDEGRLQGRLNARHLGEIDVPSKLFAVLALEIELFNAGSVDHHHARLFGVSGIDQHSLGHYFLRGAQGPAGQGAAGAWDERARLRGGRRRRRLGRPWGQ